MLRLKELRKEIGISQKQFAKDFGVGQNTVSRWETGDRLLDSETLNSVAEYFEVSTDYLLARTNLKKGVKQMEQKLNGVDINVIASIAKTHGLAVVIDGLHGPTGKSTLCENLKSMGVNAVEQWEFEEGGKSLDESKNHLCLLVKLNERVI